MRYSAVFVAFMIGITAVVTAPAGISTIVVFCNTYINRLNGSKPLWLFLFLSELAKGNTAHLAVSANEVAVTGKSYIVNEKQNYVIARFDAYTF